jgi:hypothetical protein
VSQEPGTRPETGRHPAVRPDGGSRPDSGDPSGGEDRHGDAGRLRDENLALRNRALAHPMVATAQGILMERYRLPGPDAAFGLLRETSQRYNVRLHTVADAVVRIPGPGRGAASWFPGRARTGPPPLPGLGLARHAGSAVTQGAVLSAALARVLDVTGTDMGNTQLAERRLLRLEKHHGLERRFTDYFAFVERDTTSCAQAAGDRRQVTVRDVATAPVFDEESRRVILLAGSRACHSVPVLDEHGILRGVISSHHARPLTEFGRTRLAELDTVSAAVGRWLSWHRRTVVLDALEHLHRTARRGA